MTDLLNKRLSNVQYISEWIDQTMLLKIFLHLIFLNVLNKIILGANILFIFPGPERSNYYLARTLFEELVIQGHEITVVSPISIGKNLKNVTEIQVDGVKQLFQGKNINYIDIGYSCPHITC